MKVNKTILKQWSLIICWALYDVANQFFALNVISVYFPRWLTLEKNAPEIFYSIAFAVSMILVGVMAPVMGVISDIQQRRRRYLIVFTLLSVVFTFLLGFFDNLFFALVCFAIANFGCQIATVFYNALLVKVAGKERLGLVSGLGRMFAYCGAILVLYLSKPVIAAYGYRATFILTAIAFLLFSLPAMIFIKEEKPKEDIKLLALLTKDRFYQIFRKIINTFSGKTHFKEIRLFLLAFFFILCAVQTMTLFMSVYADKAFHLSEAGIIDLIIFSTLFAILGSIISGVMCDRVGCKNTMIGIFILWFAAFIGGAFLGQPYHLLVGAMIGFALSSTWVVSRAWAIRLVPPENVGEIFGLFNSVGYLAGVVGPLYWGMMLLGLSHLGEWGYRFTLLSFIVFIAVAFFFLLKIPKGINRQQIPTGYRS